MKDAAALGMKAVHFKDLQCWQLANDLRTEVNRISANPDVARHRKFCESFEETASSVCRNTAEGFDRFQSTELARFFGYALSSLAELQDHLEECRVREFIDRPHFDRLWDLAEHTKATSRNFMRSHAARARHKRRKSRST